MAVPLYRVDMGEAGMRKILNLILAALIVLSLVACGSETSNEIRTDSGTETGQ